jgi:predicted histone-like DNA-binding protein
MHNELIMANEKYTINFSVYATPDNAISGETLYHVRQVNSQMIKREDDLADVIERNTSFTSADVKGLITAVRDQIAEYLMQGNTVSIKGLGQFFLQLGVRKEKDADGHMHRKRFTSPDDINGNDVIVEGIGFKCDKEFRSQILGQVAMRRAENLAMHSREVSRAELLVGLDNYCRENGHITRSEFQRVFGVTRYMADKMLTDLVNEPYPKYHREKVGAVYVYKKYGDKI